VVRARRGRRRGRPVRRARLRPLVAGRAARRGGRGVDRALERGRRRSERRRGDVMTPADVERCLRDYVEAVNAHDVSRMLADRHPRATLTLMGATATIETPAELDRFYRGLFAAVPG